MNFRLFSKNFCEKGILVQKKINFAFKLEPMLTMGEYPDSRNGMNVLR